MVAEGGCVRNSFERKQQPVSIEDAWAIVKSSLYANAKDMDEIYRLEEVITIIEEKL